MKFDELSEDARAEVQKQVHAYAHEIDIASMHQGIPRLRDKVALKKAITRAALIYSGYFKDTWDAAITEPAVVIEELENEVRKDEEQRQSDHQKDVSAIDDGIERAGA